MAKAGINTFDSSSSKRIYEILGPNNLATAYEITEEYMKLLDDALLSIRNAMIKINSIFDVHYKDKGHGKLKIDFPKETVKVLCKTPAPIIKSVQDLLEKAGHERKDL
jgi:copper oxidase (laccase) domain-containing protein